MKKEDQARSLFGISLTNRPIWQQFLICSSGFFFGYLVRDICEVNGCTGKMGRAVLEAAISVGLHPVSVALGGPVDSGKIVDVGGKEIEIHGMSQREDILSSVLTEYPNLIVVDYTVPAVVNENAALYCKVGVPFVMGTTGGDRELLYKTVADSNVYAVISPQMGKQVVAFLAAMEIMAEQFPGAFSGYYLQVLNIYSFLRKCCDDDEASLWHWRYGLMFPEGKKANTSRVLF